jgi:DNA-directed RNA polymerase omega subunit
MTATITATNSDVSVRGNYGWPGIISRFQLVVLAGLRSKQLLQGAQPRIAADPLKRKNTAIALEELRRGLILFNTLVAAEPQEPKVELNKPAGIMSGALVEPAS